MRRATLPIGLFLALAAAACEASSPPPGTPDSIEIPVGGERASTLPRDLAAARDPSGGLVEPSWLPDTFVLVFVDFTAFDQSASLRYEDAQHYVEIYQAHRGTGELGPKEPFDYVEIYQAHRGTGELGPKEPFDYGERTPIGTGVDWTVSGVGALDPSGTTYSGTMPDGRIVSIGSNLDAGVMDRVLRSFYVRAADGES